MAPRCVGFFQYEKTALDVIEKNMNYIHEQTYKYAVLEELEPGLYPDAKFEHWFEWKDGRYQEINKPEQFRHLCNFAIG